jgi:hypothetical protein
MTSCPKISPTNNAFETRVDIVLVYCLGYSIPNTTFVMVLTINSQRYEWKHQVILIAIADESKARTKLENISLDWYYEQTMVKMSEICCLLLFVTSDSLLAGVIMVVGTSSAAGLLSSVGGVFSPNSADS